MFGACACGARALVASDESLLTTWETLHRTSAGVAPLQSVEQLRELPFSLDSDSQDFSGHWARGVEGQSNLAADHGRSVSTLQALSENLSAAQRQLVPSELMASLRVLRVRERCTPWPWRWVFRPGSRLKGSRLAGRQEGYSRTPACIQ